MARNQEKAQSMLYRFREAQASSLGLSSGSSKNLRRPRLASSVTSLKECEKWRGEILREISRKVSKIQDFGLTDYEVRDLNDEINKLLREKFHWENQIVALGGANYKRGVPSMLDDSGREVRGTKGYKYFGRAKDLPGVKELFTRSADQDLQEQQEDQRLAKFQRFQNLPPEYYGDLDEDDGVLLTQEAQIEEAEWKEMYTDMVHRLTGSEGDLDIPTIPTSKAQNLKDTIQAFRNNLSMQYSDPTAAAAAEEDEGDGNTTTTKRKEADTNSESEPLTTKRLKTTKGKSITTSQAATAVEQEDTPAYSIFDAGDLATPAVPDRAAIEKMILQAKKRQLRQEYIESAST